MQLESSAHPSHLDHVVQFYDRDDDLFGVIGGYLTSALLDDEAVIVIATAEHSGAFLATIAEAGVDVDAAVGDGRLAVFNAAATLDLFMVDGSPDSVRFDATVGALVRRAAHPQPLRAYGEMVALLWADGNAAGALELEAMWNGLGAQVPFSLFCGYPAELVTAHGAAGLDVCRLHSDVIAVAPVPPHAEVTKRFGATNHAARSARRFVVDTLLAWSHGNLVHDATLVVTELATNAVLHARSDFTVGLSRHEGGVLLTVGDAASSAPAPRYAGPTAPGGRGLLLIETVARRWGHERVEGGKLVWAELSAS